MATPQERCKGLYPPVTDSFERGDFITLIPIVVGALLLALLISSIIWFLWYKRRNSEKHSFLECVLVYYFSISVLIHFFLERYYAHHTEEIYDHKLYNHPMARCWRWYGISDTRWLGQQPSVPRSQYSCMYGLEIMAAWGCGPSIAVTLLLYAFNNPIRWIVQVIGVTIQAYGLLITWLPPLYENNQSVPVKDAPLFWGLYLGIQSPWLFVPIIVWIQSISRIYKLDKELKEEKAKNKPEEKPSGNKQGSENKQKSENNKDETNSEKEKESESKSKEKETKGDSSGNQSGSRSSKDQTGGESSGNKSTMEEESENDSHPGSGPPEQSENNLQDKNHKN